MSAPSNVPGLPLFEQRLAARRAMLAQRLAVPVAPALAAVRQAKVEKAKTMLSNREKVASAYTSHFRALRDILNKSAAPASSSSTKPGPGAMAESA